MSRTQHILEKCTTLFCSNWLSKINGSAHYHTGNNRPALFMCHNMHDVT